MKFNVRPGAGAVAWLLTTQFFIIAAVAGAYTQPQYNGVRQVLSDLGATTCVMLPSVAYFCSPAHQLFNGSLFVQGTCMIAGALGMHALIRDRPALLACIGAGMSLYGIGAVPENTSFTLHVLFAGLHCATANAWLGRMTVLCMRSPRRFPYGARIFGLACVLGTCASIALLRDDAIRPIIGTVERFAVYPFMIMLVMLALAFFRGSFRAGGDPPLDLREDHIRT